MDENEGGNKGGNIREFPLSAEGVTLDIYAQAAKLPRDFLEKLGLRTVDNPWLPGRAAVAIPYRRRNGAAFRDRIWPSPPGTARARRPVWDKRQEKLGAILYGLEQLPGPGCPLLLVTDELSCHTLWHHGFDAVGVAGAGAYYAKRDDAELVGFSLTVLAAPGAERDELLKRLSQSIHRSSIKVASLGAYSSVHAAHHHDPSRFADHLSAAIEAAEPLETVLLREPMLDQQRQASAPPEGSVTDTLMSLAKRDAVFFSAPDDSTWAAVTIQDRIETWAIKSKGFREFLVHRYYLATAKAPHGDALTQALQTLDAIARYDGDVQAVHVRTGAVGGKYYLDLADKQWSAVEIDSEGWRVIERPPIRFQRPRGMLPLPEPVRGGSLEALRGFLNLASDADFTLILSWLLAALRPVGPYPLLAITGEPGTAKSTAARTLRALIDPNTAALRSTPREERDCWIAANNAGVLAFDNLSSIPGWLSDALCRVATGGGFATRQLHTDQDEILFDAMRATLLTSVGEVIARSDLADRAIMIELPPIADTQRLDEERFRAGFEALRPAILGALLDAMVIGLQRVAEVSLPRLPRLADFIVWASACEPAFASAGYRATYVERPCGQALSSDFLPCRNGAVICPAFKRGRRPLALMKFAKRGADQSDAL